MREDTEETLHYQAMLRAFMLTFAGTGYCPGCHQKKEVYAHRRVTPGSTKERCLECWSAEQ